MSVETTDQFERVYALYGGGGFAREMMPVLRRQLPAWAGAETLVCFVEPEPHQAEINGIPVLSEQHFLGLKAREIYFNVAIANSRIREKVVNLCVAHGAQPLALVADDVICYETAPVGEGAILCARSVITTAERIGRYFHSNFYSYVAHDCVIGDYVTFGPRVTCCGAVQIHDHAYIGAGAVIRQSLPGRPMVIGEGAVVGMGAVVVRDVAPYTTVVGNPARPLVRTGT